MIEGGKFLFVLAGHSRGHVVSVYGDGFAVAEELGGAGRYVGSKVGRPCAVPAKCGMTSASGGSSGQVPSPGSPSSGRPGAVPGGGAHRGGGSGGVPATG